MYTVRILYAYEYKIVFIVNLFVKISYAKYLYIRTKVTLFSKCRITIGNNYARKDSSHGTDSHYIVREYSLLL